MTESIKESLTAIKKAVNADGSALSDILLVTGKIGKVLSFVSSGYDILTTLGILESTETKILKEIEKTSKKLEEISKQVEEIRQDIQSLKVEINERFREVKGDLSEISSIIEWSYWTSFIQKFESDSEEALQAVSSLWENESHQQQVLIHDNKINVDKWSDSFYKEASKSLYTFHRYFCYGSDSVPSRKTPLEQIVELFINSKASSQSVYYLTLNYSFRFLRLYVVLYYGCHLALKKAKESPKTDTDIETFQQEIKTKLEDILKKIENILEEKVTARYRCYVCKDLKDEYLSFSSNDTSYIDGFRSVKHIVPGNYQNYVVVGMRLVEDPIRETDFLSSFFGKEYRYAQLQLKIGKIGPYLSIHDVHWLDVDKSKSPNFSEILFSKSKPYFNIAFDRYQCFVNEATLPDEIGKLNENEIAVVTGAKISEDNQGHIVLKTYSRPLNLSNPEEPVLRSNYSTFDKDALFKIKNTSVEINSTVPQVNDKNYFRLREQSSSGGTRVEFLDLQEVVPLILSPLRGASFCYRGNRVSLQLRTDLPFHRLPSLRPVLNPNK